MISILRKPQLFLDYFLSHKTRISIVLYARISFNCIA